MSGADSYWDRCVHCGERVLPIPDRGWMHVIGYRERSSGAWTAEDVWRECRDDRAQAAMPAWLASARLAQIDAEREAAKIRDQDRRRSIPWFVAAAGTWLLTFSIGSSSDSAIFIAFAAIILTAVGIHTAAGELPTRK